MPKLKLKPVVISVACAFSIAGCASLTSSKTGEPWTVQPAFSVNHAGPKADAMYRLGRFYQGQRRYAEAIAAYRQALAQDPGHLEAHNGLGVIHAEQGRYDEAMKEFQAALAVAPSAAYLHNNLGFVLLLQNSNEKAVAVLEEARRLEPGNTKVRDNLIIGYERLVGERKAQPTVVAAEPQADPARVAVEVRTADSGVGLIAVSPESRADPARTAIEVRTADSGVGLIAVSPESGTDPAQAPVEVRTAASGVSLVAVAPAVYELQAPGADNASTPHAAEPAADATAVSPEHGSAPPSTAGRATSGRLEGRQQGRAAGAEVSGAKAPFAGANAAGRQALDAFKLEVSNGNGVGGLAARVADYLGRLGVSTGRLTNDKPFAQPSTMIQYREGYRMQAAHVGSMLPKTVPVVSVGTLRGDIHVRVVLGHDLRKDVALFDAAPTTLQLVAEAPGGTAR